MIKYQKWEDQEWKPILDYNRLYMVSDYGEIYSLIKNRLRKPVLGKWGYYFVRLSKNGKTKNHYIHQLVCRAFHGPRPKNMEVSHINENSQDNRADNLCWTTRKSNCNQPQIKLKQSLARIGKKVSEKTKIKMSISTKKWHEKNTHPFKGKKHTEETKRKISQSLKDSRWQ